MTWALTSRAARLFLLVLWLVAPLAASAAAQDPSPPPEREWWSKAERWAWRKISAGEIADFNKLEGRKNAPLEPTEPDGWGEKRRLSARFLKEIIFRQPYRSALPFEGIRIVGAHFPETVDLAHGRLDRQLWLEKCRFEGKINLTGLRVDGWLSLVGSAFGQADPAEVDLSFAEIKGSVKLSEIKGSVAMNSLVVEQHLVLHSAKLEDVVLSSARVGGLLSLFKAEVAGDLEMDSLEVKQMLSMRRAKLKDAAARVVLRGARVGSDLVLDNVEVAGDLEMDSLAVEQGLFMRAATFEKPIALIFSRVGAGLDLSGAQFANLDLSATRVEGELRLGPWPREWPDGARLTMRNAHAGAVQDYRGDTTNAWPDELLLDGFTYDRLGGYGGDEPERDAGQQDTESDMLARDLNWYRDWLARDPSYAPQPYEQLAATFRAAGEPSKADDILYAGRERERADAWNRCSYARWLWLSLLNLTIRYGLGLGYFYALRWVLGFTLLGTIFLFLSRQGPGGLFANALFSLDRLLPIVELDKAHDDIKLEGWIRYWFATQALFGFVLGSFIVAGLAGLTQ